MTTSSPDAPRKPHVGRRSLVRGAAWSVPTITVVSQVPALAASNCNAVTFRWLEPAAGRDKKSTFDKGTVGGVTMSVSISGPGAGSANNKISPDSGGFNSYTSYYEQELLGSATNISSPLSTTLLFSQPVKDLSFTFFDLDQNNTSDTPGFSDGVAITSHTSAGGDFSYLGGSVIAGSGTTTDPWRPIPNTGSINGQEGNVAVIFQVPVTSITWDFTDRTDQVSVGHFIGLTDLRFTPTIC